MSILIKDMEIPKGCNNCNFQCFTEWGGDSPYTNEIATKCLVTDKFVFPSDSERDVNCPLISIPPQGRMIDVDVLLKKVYKLRMWLLENNMPGAEHWVTKVYQMIDEVADGGENDCN